MSRFPARITVLGLRSATPQTPAFSWTCPLSPFPCYNLPVPLPDSATRRELVVSATDSGTVSTVSLQPLPRTQPDARAGTHRVRPGAHRWESSKQRRAASSQGPKNHRRNHGAAAHRRCSRIDSARCALRRRRRNRHQQGRGHDRSCRRGKRLRTLVNALLGRGKRLRRRAIRCGRESCIGWTKKPRSDPCGKNDAAHAKMGEAFRQRAVKKTYIALVQGILEEKSAASSWPLARPYPSHTHDDGAQIMARRGHRESARGPHGLESSRQDRQHDAGGSPTPHRAHASDSSALLRTETSGRWRYLVWSGSELSVEGSRCRRSSVIFCTPQSSASRSPDGAWIEVRAVLPVELHDY